MGGVKKISRIVEADTESIRNKNYYAHHQLAQKQEQLLKTKMFGASMCMEVKLG